MYLFIPDWMFSLNSCVAPFDDIRSVEEQVDRFLSLFSQ